MRGSSEALPRFACPDWWDKIQRGETPIPEVPLNAEKAARVLAFFNRLKLPDVPGHPTMREACGPWFIDVLLAFLASEDPETGRRLVWECLVEVPKKNSKSTYTAGLALTALHMEETPNGQMLLIGPSQNISARCFDQARDMVRLDPMLSQTFQVRDHLKTITRLKTGTSLAVKTFDPSIVTGEIPLLTIIDEVHELGKKSRAMQVMQQVRGGGITTTGGGLFMITTQSDEEPKGLWRSEIKKARKIRDGKAGPAPIMLPVLYEFPEDVQKDEDYWRDQSNWAQLLPNMGRSIDMAKLVADYENNGTVTPEAEQIWLSQHLNIEIGLGRHSDTWAGADYWEACADPDLADLDALLDRCEVAVIGGDIGGAYDLASLNVMGRCRETQARLTWGRSWCVPDVKDKLKEIGPKLDDLAAIGQLRMDPDIDTHVAEMVEVCLHVNAAELLPKKAAIGLDPWGVAALVDALLESGFSQNQIYGVEQGYKLNGAIKGCERRLINRTLLHGDQEMMAWAVSNAKAEPRGNNTMITKQRAGMSKIDPLIAMFNAAIMMDMNPRARRRDLSQMLANPVQAA